MGGHGTVRASLMEGDPSGTTLIDWIVRLALFSLAVAAVWTVFGDDIAQFLGR